MNITLLGQGFEAESEFSVGKQLIKFFADKDFHTFTGISAFASQAGVKGLSKHIAVAKKHFNIITIVTGIDKRGTSQEALLALLDLNINAFVFFVPPPKHGKPIFHPKIYLFEGKDKSELIIGSSNLTSNGLFANVEASLLISIDNNVEADRKIVEQLKDYFKGIFDFTDPNLKKLSNEIIADLVDANIVPTEAERKAAQDKVEKAEVPETEKIISKIFPKRAIAKIPNEFRGTKKPTTKTKAATAPVAGSVSGKGELVWESGKLTERDLNIPKGANTNNTGDMLIKKGLLKDIDQRHYFRDIVFSSLKWKQDKNPGKSHFERATAKFQIIVLGKNYGSFELKLSHNSNNKLVSYEQHQPMTKIHWGYAKKIIAKDNLIGKSASLFKTKKPDQFILSIQ